MDGGKLNEQMMITFRRVALTATLGAILGAVLGGCLRVSCICVHGPGYRKQPQRRSSFPDS
jgi:hypothetical protein